jgi:Spy/CpxP family protein refolding chaperone
MKTRRAILATLGIIAVLVPAAIWAAGPDGHGGMGFGMGAGPFGMGGGNVLRLAKKLGLSSDQVTQIKGILSAARTANAPTRTQLKTNQQAFQAS